MTQGNLSCNWCGADPHKKMPNDISPHSTWCPFYRSPPSARQIKREFDEMCRSIVDGKQRKGLEMPTIDDVIRPSMSDQEAMELAYGLLWMVGCDRSTKAGEALYIARKALYEKMDRAGQARGISAAREALGVHYIRPLPAPQY